MQQWLGWNFLAVDAREGMEKAEGNQAHVRVVFVCMLCRTIYHELMVFVSG